MGDIKARILMIDDDENFLHETQELLKEAGYETRGCGDPRQALSVIQEYKPDCIIVDFCMPGLDGQDLLLLMHRKFPDLPVIVCSGMPEMDHRHLLKAGATEVMQKPFSHNAFFSAIEQALSQKEEIMPVVVKGFNLREIRNTVLRKVIIKALSRTDFNITHSAALLGVSRQCLLRYIKQLRIVY